MDLPVLVIHWPTQNQRYSYMDPTGASTFIDMSRLNVGESYAEEVFPFGSGVFRVLMVEFIVGDVIPGRDCTRRGIIASQFREQKKKRATHAIYLLSFRTPGLAHALSLELWFTYRVRRSICPTYQSCFSPFTTDGAVYLNGDALGMAGKTKNCIYIYIYI